MSAPIRYAQVGSPLIHAVPMTGRFPLRPLCGHPPTIDLFDLFDMGSEVWLKRSGDRCSTCARRHPPLDGETHD